MQTVIPVEDVASGAGTPAGQPNDTTPLWQDYYSSSTPTASLTDWQSGSRTQTGQSGDNAPVLALAVVVVGLGLVLGSGRR